MVADIDAFAFKLLITLFSILGIKEIPDEHNLDWTIEKKWIANLDDTYQLVMISTTLPQLCKNIKTGFVVFPQTYMGKMRVYADNQLIFTNSMSKPWNLMQLLSKPLINCEIFENSTNVKFEITSYMKFFNSVSGYPEMTIRFPWQYIFYEEMFVISGVAALFLGIIGTILISKISTLSEAFLYFVQQFSFCVFVFFHVPGKLIDVNLGLPHIAIVVSGFFGLTSLALNTYQFSVKKIKILFIMSIFFVAPAIFFYGYKNATHLYVLSLIVIAILVSGALVIYKIINLSKEKEYLNLFLYILLFVLIIFDGAGSQINRVSFLHLSGIAMVATTISFVRVLNGFNLQRDLLISTDVRLQAETKSIKSIMDIYTKYKEIIHDIKSPIMSLMFLMPQPEKNKELIVTATSRIRNILSRIENDQILMLTDWYSMETLISNLNKIIYEKKAVHNNLTFCVTDFHSRSSSVLLNPIDFDVIMEELIDNSTKYSDGDILIDFKLLDKYLCVEFKSKNAPTEEDLSKNYLKKIGQGIGLQNIKKKLNLMSGYVEIDNEMQLFTVKIYFLLKNAS